MRWLRCACLLLVFAGICSALDSQPLVATQEGVVRGLPGLSAAGNPFYSFRGIPYARAPVGPLRFQPPRRHPGWGGVLDASAHRDKCLQRNLFRGNEIEGNENCLFVNVYTPNLPELPITGSGLPVMVWVHGGGFIFGDGNDEIYGPKYLLDGGVVLVTFNYRLGPFGFFTTDDSNAPGNYGLRDQVLLLQWVRDNIASFGGDPKLVTIFGESAGGASVSLLVLSPLTKGLFHHAISQSGSANNDWAVSEKRLGLASKYAEKLNCTTDNPAELVDCIRAANGTFLQSLVDPMDPAAWTFSPRVDRDSSTPFLPDSPRRLLETGRFNLVPWMSGVTEEECSGFSAMFTADPDGFAKLVARDHVAYCKVLQIPADKLADAFDCGADPDAEIDKILDFYMDRLGALSDDNLFPLSRMLTDRMMVIPIMEEIRLASGHTPVYKYVLDHRGPGRLGMGDFWPEIFPAGPDFGVGHADDLAYLFTNNVTGIASRDSPAYSMIQFMVDVWTTFARTGRPSSTVLPMPEWPIYTENSQRHMHLNSESSLGERLFEERVKFWNEMPVNDPWKHTVRVGRCPSDKDEL